MIGAAAIATLLEADVATEIVIGSP